MCAQQGSRDVSWNTARQPRTDRLQDSQPLKCFNEIDQIHVGDMIEDPSTEEYSE